MAHTNPSCGVGANVQLVTEGHFQDTQHAAECAMKRTALEQIIPQYETRIASA
ncbi:hypothetical protein [uncultured Slackia sp.]|uniref:hypothetical protein n=1 Tax=uncultured Slackia sp. TaxID=665903 RepID=UPI0025D883CE|nr:hypothetical protein [uncultured Slackia sp.]